MRATNLFIAAFVVLTYGARVGAQEYNVPQSLTDAGYASEVIEQVEMLTSAYQLDEATQSLLIEELYRRGEEAVQFDVQLQQELAKLLELGDEAEIIRRGQELVAAAPLAQDNVASWVEARLPAEAVERGRPRFEELKQLRTNRLDVSHTDTAENSGAKATRMHARIERNAPVDERFGTPLPRGRKGEQIARKMDELRSRAATEIQKPNTPAVPAKTPKQDARPKIDRGKSDTKLPAVQDQAAAVDAPYVKAPPLDEWDKHVAGIAEKYAFTDAQVTKAQSILRDLRRRAYQYRLSRTQEYEAADKIADKAKRDAQLKYLDKATDALFAELKQRLESLPTIEQRQKAGAVGAKPR